MVLVRVWRRQLLGGMGTAMIVPGMLVASLVVLGLAGGFGGLTALGQALSGPSMPASTGAAGHGGSTARAVPPALVAALSAPAASPRSAAGSGSATAPRTVTAGPEQRVLVGQSPRQPSRPAEAPGGRRTRTPTPPPRPQQTLIDRVVGAGTAVTSQVPGPAGPAATKALQAAGSTLDSIVPIKSP